MEHAYDKISWLFNYAPVGIIFVSPDGQILNCNPKAYELFNRKEEELSRQSVFSFIKEEETAALKKPLNTYGKTRNALPIWKFI